MLGFLRRNHTERLGIDKALRQLGLGNQAVMLHSSLSAFGHVVGGAPTVLDAVLSQARTVVMPAFTYYTLAWPNEHRQNDWPKPPPPDGPAFAPNSPVSNDIGRVAQLLLEQPHTERSDHPALSFAAHGPDAHQILAAQTHQHPYAPVGVLGNLDGLVVLFGVDQRSNTSIHYGEYLAGRPMLPRYAKTNQGLVRADFPNCSGAFNGLAPHLKSLRNIHLGHGQIQVMRVREVISETQRLLHRNAEALLCDHWNCRCQHVRQQIRKHGLNPRNDGLGHTTMPHSRR